MERGVYDKPIGTLPLREVTQQYGEAGLLERLECELDSTGWDDETLDHIDAAKTIALLAHDGVMRGPLPYSTHVLRVALRTLSSDHLSIRDDPDLVIAALLHDTVEDNPAVFETEAFPNTSRLSQREHAFSVIRVTFGERAETIVCAVTNPERDPQVSRDEKRASYQAHVRDLLQVALDDGDEAPALLKLSDFIDNCAGLWHNENPQLAAKLAAKYLALIPDFIGFVNQSQVLSIETKQAVIAQLEKATATCSARLAHMAHWIIDIDNSVMDTATINSVAS